MANMEQTIPPKKIPLVGRLAAKAEAYLIARRPSKSSHVYVSKPQQSFNPAKYKAGEAIAFVQANGHSKIRRDITLPFKPKFLQPSTLPPKPTTPIRTSFPLRSNHDQRPIPRIHPFPPHHPNPKPLPIPNRLSPLPARPFPRRQRRPDFVRYHARLRMGKRSRE